MNTLALKWFYKFLGKSPADMDMVQYWKFKDSVQAKVVTNKEGSLEMIMEGEKYPHPGFPRGYLLYGKLSKLKHEIKNQIFNENWARLEKGEPVDLTAFSNIFEISDSMKYDMVPPSRMAPAVREIYRAWTKATNNEVALKIRDILTFIIQEDDSYRFRVQWLVTWFNPNRWYMRLLGKDPVMMFYRALLMLEHAEVIGDMKERIRLLRRVLMACLKDEKIRGAFLRFVREVDWNKVKLSEADKFHFRGKYFKVDLDLFDY